MKNRSISIEELNTDDKEQVELFFKENMGLIGVVIKKYLNKGVEYDDLLQVGSEFLYLAIMRFDKNNGASFSSYACSYIDGGVKRYLREKTNVIRIPRSLYSDIYTYRRLIQDYSSREVQEKMNLSDEAFSKIISAAETTTNTVSLDFLLASETDNSGGGSFGDLIPSDTNVENTVIGNITYEELMSEVRKMGDRCEEVVLRRLNGETQVTIAAQMGISRAYVSRLLKTVGVKLKRAVPELDTEDRKVKHGEKSKIFYREMGVQKELKQESVNRGLTAKEAVAEVVKYIENNISEPIIVKDILSKNQYTCDKGIPYLTLQVKKKLEEKGYILVHSTQSQKSPYIVSGRVAEVEEKGTLNVENSVPLFELDSVEINYIQQSAEGYKDMLNNISNTILGLSQVAALRGKKIKFSIKVEEIDK